MQDNIVDVEVLIVTIPRDEPYLGPLGGEESVNSDGYFVRQGNGTAYPTVDRSIVVKIETKNNVVGWGETYGLIAPRATTALITDFLKAFLIGRDPTEPELIHDDLYKLTSVRGYTGGFFMDALAAIDIALWDISGKIANRSISSLLGGAISNEVPAYVSGLPARTLDARVRLARHWQDRGFKQFKFALPIANEGSEKEMASLRSELGDDVDIACDMHWSLEPDTAIELIEKMDHYRLWFAEAPVRTEDVDGLARVAHGSKVKVAAGEEWRTDWEAKQRTSRRACSILQPEMGHTGITQFRRIAALAEPRSLSVLPHATIGIGIFMAASLQVSAVLASVVGHEYQHSIFDKNLRFLDTDMACKNGRYRVPQGPGLGVEPIEDKLRSFAEIA